MSRIGKNPVVIPAGVQAALAGQMLNISGGKGKLSLAVSPEVTATIADGNITIAPKDESKHARAMWGTTRALVNNMVTGVSTGFTRMLEINGVGYRAAVQGRTLNLQLGYSHDIAYPIPQDIQIACERPTLIANSASVRSPPRSDRTAPPNPTRARASSMPRKPSVVRKARRSNRHGEKFSRTFSAPKAAGALQIAPNRQIAPAADRVSLVEAYLRAGHRRCGRPYAGRSLDA